MQSDDGLVTDGAVSPALQETKVNFNQVFVYDLSILNGF